MNARRLCALAVGINLVAALAALGLVDRSADELPPANGTGLVAAAGSTPALVPAQIEIPSVGVSAAVVPVGILPTGEMEVPNFGSAGWYRLGPRPGERGPAVIAAHFDSYTGPDVFYGLRRLKAGDPIVVSDSAGRRLVFVVLALETTPKDRLPVERIWGPVTTPVLRLITCGGTFDRRARHYRSNLVVFAQLAPTAVS